MPRPRSAQASALLRLEIHRLSPEAQAEMQRLRMTALEMAIPVDSLWMFLPESSVPSIPVRREPSRLQRCMAARLRIRSRRGMRVPKSSNPADPARDAGYMRAADSNPAHVMAPCGTGSLT
jgi:hypothetical protein